MDDVNMAVKYKHDLKPTVFKSLVMSEPIINRIQLVVTDVPVQKDSVSTTITISAWTQTNVQWGICVELLLAETQSEAINVNVRMDNSLTPVFSPAYR